MAFRAFVQVQGSKLWDSETEDVCADRLYGAITFRGLWTGKLCELAGYLCDSLAKVQIGTTSHESNTEAGFCTYAASPTFGGGALCFHRRNRDSHVPL
jgi:hypothetical protein